MQNKNGQLNLTNQNQESDQSLRMESNNPSSLLKINSKKKTSTEHQLILIQSETLSILALLTVFLEMETHRKTSKPTWFDKKKMNKKNDSFYTKKNYYHLKIIHVI